VETNYEISLNTAVFTTKYVLKRISPVLQVYHFEDGSWQFCGPEQALIDEDYRVISLNEMLLLDSSLRMLGNLEVGFEAIRKSKKDNWKIIQIIN
jgi:hypothetical protein